MATIYVQFSDSKETAISSIFSCPQDPVLYFNQGEIDTSDDRYKSFFNSLPAVNQANLPSPD